MSGAAARARAQYRRHLKERVKFARASGTGAAANIAWDETRFLRANIRGYAPHEIAGNVMQGDTEVMILAEDLDAATDNTPPRNGDRIQMPSGGAAIVQDCDANTRRVGGETIAYVCRVRGG